MRKRRRTGGLRSSEVSASQGVARFLDRAGHVFYCRRRRLFLVARIRRAFTPAAIELVSGWVCRWTGTFDPVDF